MAANSTNPPERLHDAVGREPSRQRWTRSDRPRRGGVPTQLAVEGESQPAAAALMQLQRSIGNQATADLLRLQRVPNNITATGGPVVQRGEGDRATPAEILAALLKLLRELLPKQIRVLSKKSGLTGLTELAEQMPHAIGVPFLALCSDTQQHMDALGDLIMHIATEARDVLKDDEDWEAANDFGELVLTTGKVTAPDLGEPASTKLRGCIGRTKAAQNVSVEFKERLKTLETVGSKLIKVCGTTTMWCGGFLTDSAKAVVVEREQLEGCVSDVKALKVPLLLERLQVVSSGALDALKLHGPDAVEDLCFQAVVNLDWLAQDDETLKGCVYSIISSADLDLRASARSCQRLRKLLTGPTFSVLGKYVTRPSFSKLMDCYGWPGLQALLRLDVDELPKVFEMIQTTTVWMSLTKSVPGGSSVNVLVFNFRAIARCENVFAVLGFLQNPGVVKIVCPKTMAVIGWDQIGTHLVPSAFSGVGWATDLACLKHVEDDVGSTADQDWLQEYFAELFVACKAAVDTMKGSGPCQAGDTFLFVKKVGHGTWTIRVKRTVNGYEIYHIDAGYQNSKWQHKNAKK